ncbi:hypothetical protein J2S43_001648 [Catenuloplanes nepalensis]|uniref:PPM-type phosphatase domain-containing protein n=1 Tax=Catenuloplanes nepalensis TaxID=587533 RepID=A0ABT9MNY7_9ACTN|nr:protein phosphatase 2C domain-containing protein [Catenuloplanes nepalensis]MDP9793136.1 hypothetical protein [Catenuloplanes nepalensis]
MTWSVLAGSSAGGAHDRAAAGSQDAHLVAEIAGVLVIAVADGAGSRRHAAIGATLAVGMAHQEVGRLLRGRAGDSADIRGAARVGARRTVRRFHRSVTALARAAGARPADFATTLTVVLARPPWVGAFSVGDGFVVTRNGAGELTLLHAPPREAARPPGAATLMPSRFGRVRVSRRLVRIDGLTGVAAGTDGLETLLIEFAGTQPVRPAAEPFGRLFGLADDPGTDPSALTRMLAGRRVGELTDDDRTLVLAVPR